MGWWTSLQASGRYGVARFLDGHLEDGEAVVLSLVTVRGPVADGVDVEKDTIHVTVVGLEGLSPGQNVSIGGTWRAENGVVDADWVEDHPGRGSKSLLGALGVLVVVLLGPVFVRVEDRVLVLRG